MKRRIIVLFVYALLVTIVGVIGNSVENREVAKADTLNVKARAAVLMHSDTGKNLYEQDSTKRLQIASMVKIMTLNLIFEEIESGNLSYEDMVVASENATSMGGSQAFLDTNSAYRVDELTKSIIVASANDSCVAMAEHICGSVSIFVERMNEKASLWGMNDTHFVNCTGLPAPNQYSCAKDVAIMMNHLINHNGFFEFSKIWMFDFEHPSGRKTQLANTNKLVRYYEGCDGGKTGFTSEAMSCLAATAERGETRFICVVVGAENSKIRNAEISKLLDYGFANYESKKYFSKGDVLSERANVCGGKSDSVGCVVGSDIIVFDKKGLIKDCVIEKEIYDISAPIRIGQKIGTIKIIKNGEVLATSEILSDSEVKKKSFFDIVDEIVKSW